MESIIFFDETETRLCAWTTIQSVKRPGAISGSDAVWDGSQFSHTIEEQVEAFAGGIQTDITYMRTPMVRAICMNTASQTFFGAAGTKREVNLADKGETYMAEILLLEDEESVNRGIEFTLKKEGYEVENAGTIREAWELFQKQEPKLMICDVNLPDGSSLDLIRRIRKTSLVHVICLTAMDTEIDQVMGYEAGADDYITKPFSLSVLVLKVNAFFKRYQKSPADELESGDLLFSMSRMSARKGQEDISFTKNEWKMLKLFLEHPKQILSKNQILEQLFDLDGEFADEITVAVNIRRLREKIEPDTAHPQYIRNIRGLGYIWDQNCQQDKGAAYEVGHKTVYHRTFHRVSCGWDGSPGC